MADSEEIVLVIEIKNNRPVDLLDLTRSLEALATQYRAFAKAKGYDVADENVRLYVHELRSGSIIAELASYAEQASMVLDHLTTLGGFVSHINEITNYFLGRRDNLPETDKKELQNISKIYEVTAKDQSAQFNTFVSEGGQVVQNFNFSIDSNEARSVQNGISRRLDKKPKDKEDEDEFEEEYLIIFQARGVASSKAGDLGIIDKFSEKPLRLRFSSEEAKAAILEEERVFKLVYVVRGKVETAGGVPVGYKIHEVLDTFERPDLG